MGEKKRTGAEADSLVWGKIAVIFWTPAIIIKGGAYILEHKQKKKKKLEIGENRDRIGEGGERKPRLVGKRAPPNREMRLFCRRPPPDPHTPPNPKKKGNAQLGGEKESSPLSKNRPPAKTRARKGQRAKKTKQKQIRKKYLPGGNGETEKSKVVRKKSFRHPGARDNSSKSTEAPQKGQRDRPRRSRKDGGKGNLFQCIKAPPESRGAVTKEGTKSSGTKAHRKTLDCSPRKEGQKT